MRDTAATDRSGHLPLLRAWVSAEAAAVLAAADDFGLLSTFPAALAARGEVVSFLCLVTGWSLCGTTGIADHRPTMSCSQNGRKIIVPIMGSLT